MRRYRIPAQSVPPVPPGIILPHGETAGADLGRPPRPSPSAWLVGGVAAAGISAGTGLAPVLAGHPASIQLLVGGGATAMVSVLAGAAGRMYKARQETRRLEIQHRSRDMIAGALSRCIDAAHITVGTAIEVDNARAAAAQALAKMTPAVLAALGIPPSEPALPRPDQLEIPPLNLQRHLVRRVLWHANPSPSGFATIARS
jgi:hypothetical protein